jgi:tRNA A-37 threonylcarbamoyl transferase component Bud32
MLDGTNPQSSDERRNPGEGTPATGATPDAGELHAIDAALRSLGDDVAQALDAGALKCGPYRLMQRIGEGGYGEVFAAVNDALPDQRVAVKILKRGRDTRAVLRRFEMEKRALARIEHACVTPIVTAGSSADGRPWFSMPLIDGSPITAACDALGIGMDVRLDLMARVCDGVHAAHVQGIVHRDLKPSNILLAQAADGALQPRVIDFGIAKMLDDSEADRATRTAETVRLGTPAYMAPEQGEGLAGAADTRSDIYALGRVLGELVSGDASPDVRAIIAKATMPEPALRYQSADALAADLRRVLAHQPVSARAPGLWYLVTRFVRRNRATVAVGGVVLLVVTTLGAMAAYNAHRSQLADRAAALEGSRAIRTSEVLQDLFAGIDPEVAQGRDRTLLIELLQRTAADLRAQDETDDLVVQARLGAIIGRAFASLEEPQQALAVLRPLVERLDRMVVSPQVADDLSAWQLERARVYAALGLALKALDDSAYGGGDRIRRFPETAAAWTRAMDLFAAHGYLDDPIARDTALRLWMSRESWPADRAFDEFEAWLEPQMIALPDDDPSKWSYRLRKAEIYPWILLVQRYPPVVAEFAKHFGEDHPRVVRARARELSFVVGGAIESRAERDLDALVPRYGDEELREVWQRAFELGEVVIPRCERIFGPTHMVTLRARLSHLAAVGHSQGANAARPLYERWRSEAAQADGAEAPGVAQFDMVWRGVLEGPAMGRWWINQPKGGTPGMN